MRNERAVLGPVGSTEWSTPQLAEELPLVHAVLKGLAAVDEDHGDFVIELAADFAIGVHIDFSPSESAPARKFGQALFHHFTQVASLAGVNHDVAGLKHAERF